MTKRKPRKSRDDWVLAAIDVLGRGGIKAVRVEPLAKALGVTKGSFYWHFKDRDALVMAVLERWEADGTETIIQLVDAGAQTPEARIELLWEIAMDDGGVRSELTLRELAQRDDRVAEIVRRVDSRRLKYVQDLFAGLGADPNQARSCSLLLYGLLIGEVFIYEADDVDVRAAHFRDAARLLTQQFQQLTTSET